MSDIGSQADQARKNHEERLQFADVGDLAKGLNEMIARFNPSDLKHFMDELEGWAEDKQFYDPKEPITMKEYDDNEAEFAKEYYGDFNADAWWRAE